MNKPKLIEINKWFVRSGNDFTIFLSVDEDESSMLTLEDVVGEKVSSIHVQLGMNPFFEWWSREGLEKCEDNQSLKCFSSLFSAIFSNSNNNDYLEKYLKIIEAIQ